LPLPLSSTAIAEKNKLYGGSVWLLALKLDIPGVGTPVRVVNNTENITWDGETWVAASFGIEPYREARKETPLLQLRISNVSRAIETYLQEYEVYCITNGPQPIIVTVYLLNSLNLASSTPEVELELELLQPNSDAYFANFRLGAVNIFNDRFPRGRMTKNHCRYLDDREGGFKGALCGYAGAGTSCDGTLSTCRNYGNSKRFGGSPGVGGRGVMLV